MATATFKVALVIFKITRLQLEVQDERLQCNVVQFYLHSACYFTLFSSG